MDLFKGLDPKQRTATMVLAGLTLFFMGYVGASYLQAPKDVSLVQLGGGALRQSASATTRLREKVSVHVAGEVNRPGVVTVGAGAKVLDAINAAGGAVSEADLDSLNLAAPVVDGQKITVGKVGGSPSVASASTVAEPQVTGDGLISINTASVSELDKLPGIGPSKAAAIIEYREKIGGFKSLEELNAVKGIGDKTFAKLLPLIKL